MVINGSFLDRSNRSGDLFMASTSMVEATKSPLVDGPASLVIQAEAERSRGSSLELTRLSEASAAASSSPRGILAFKMTKCQKIRDQTDYGAKKSNNNNNETLQLLLTPIPQFCLYSLFTMFQAINQLCTRDQL